MTRPPILIEEWLPIEAIGAESKRERGASSALPPLYFLHVWWARRPLTTSRAAILAGVLPQWNADWPEKLAERFPDKESYHNWFIHLCGIRGDPVKGRRLIDWAKAKGIKLDFHPYGGAPRAFTVNPSPEDLALLGDLLEWTWGSRDLSVLDPFAGGGSIPFEALRYGFTTIANDLNPVAAVILKATLDYPARFGPGLADDIRKWGDIWAKRVEERLAPYFPKAPGENIFAYLWARTVACPSTGKPVPLSPNWWLRKGSDPVAVKLIAEPGMDTPRFEIVTGKAVAAARPDEGTISRGVGRSPWTGEPIDGDYIKAEAQAGRMGQMLYAVATKASGGFTFRAPTNEDLAAVQRAEAELARRRPEWLAKGIIPTEAFPSGNDNRPLTYGMPTWADFFSPRQLLTIGIFIEALSELESELCNQTDSDRANAIITYLGIGLNKCPNYNSRLSVWHPTWSRMANTFNKHDYAFAWSHGEFDGASNLLPWAVGQAAKSYGELADISSPAQLLLQENQRYAVDQLRISKGTAANLTAITNASIHCITVDPPYYDNVQYAELSDFFYVWLKRSVGHLFPDFFQDELTNKDDEAVANPARFAALGRKKKQLAEEDYQRKMAAAFGEMHRVLRDDGVLTVMFTHKRIEAWDTLASALIGAGFTIQASWPVHTESEHSLHQAQKNAAASTILLVCRKREEEGRTRGQEEGMTGKGSDPFLPSSLPPFSPSPVWWEDIQGEVRRTARQKAADYLAQGIRGVDLYISTFGPTLSIISQRWPVLTGEIDPKSGQPLPLRPEMALDLARQEVIRLRKEGLLEGRNVQFDPVTDWALMAWDAFQAEQFPYDEARKLAIALGLELDSFLMSSKRLVAKKGQFVVIQQPSQRRKRGMVDPDALLFEHWIDAAHTAMLIYAEDGPGACDLFLRQAGLKRDSTFIAVVQALLHAIPRTRVKGEFARPEAAVLDNLRLAFYADDIPAPVEVEPVSLAEQMGFGVIAGGEEFEEEEEDGEQEEE